MTTVSVQNSSMDLSELIRLARKDFVVLRHKDKISFALVRLDEGDLEALSLSQNSDFMAMLDNARARYDAKRGLALEEIKQRFGKRRRQSSPHKKASLKGAKSLLDPNIGFKVSQSVRQARERHAMLIDKKFKQSLTQKDQLELESLESLLDKAERPFYETIIQRLIVERDKLMKDLTKDR